MRKETTKNSKRSSKAQRQKQKLIIIGGMAIILLILVILLGIFVLGSCGIDYSKTDRNTVFILKDGKIVSTDLENFDGSKYDAEKLGSYVANVIDTCNKKNGEESLIQKEFIVEENKATLILEYANADIFEEINGVELFCGSLDKVGEAGYTLTSDIKFAKVADGKASEANLSDFADNSEYKIVVIKSNTKVVVPGEICYVSTENVSKVGKDYVIIEADSQLLPGEDNSEIGTESTTEFGTEVEGTIGETEIEGGDGEIIFDFGDVEEPEVEEDQHNEVLTYIIYK